MAKVQYPVLDLVTGVGRLVQGNLATPNPNDMHGKPREKPQYFFALAVPKTDPGVVAQIQAIQTHAWTSYGQMPQVTQRLSGATAEAIAAKYQVQHYPGHRYNPITRTYDVDLFLVDLEVPDFAWKIEDGDLQKNAGKEGFAGSYIFKFATVLPIKCSNNENIQIDPASVDLGCWGDVGFSVSINGNIDKTAGIYMNPACFRRLGYGTKINPGPAIGTIMGAAPTMLPPGASATPVAPAPAPALPGMASGVPQAPAAPAPAAYAPPAAPVAPPAPPAAPAPSVTPEQESAAIAGHYRVQHHPGWRYDPASNSYVQDPVAPLAPPAAGPAVPAGVTAPPVPPAAPGGYPATAYPSSPPAPGVSYAPAAPGYSPPAAPGYAAGVSPSNVPPHPQFVHGQPPAR